MTLSDYFNRTIEKRRREYNNRYYAPGIFKGERGVQLLPAKLETGMSEGIVNSIVYQMVFIVYQTAYQG